MDLLALKLTMPHPIGRRLRALMFPAHKGEAAFAFAMLNRMIRTGRLVSVRHT